MDGLRTGLTALIGGGGWEGEREGKRQTKAGQSGGQGGRANKNNTGFLLLLLQFYIILLPLLLGGLKALTEF